MESINIYESIHNYCLKNANTENITKYSRFFKEGYRGYGLTSDQIKQIAKELSKNKDIKLENILNFSDSIFKDKMYDEIAIFLLLIFERKKIFDIKTLQEIEYLFKIGIDNWAHADILGMMILPQFISGKIVDENYFKQWLISANKFQRRCIPVTLIKSIKTIDHIENLFAIIEPLMLNNERETNQGTGWFMKKAWDTYPSETELFLSRYIESSPRIIFQIACEKMNPETKQKFRKIKNKK